MASSSVGRPKAIVGLGNPGPEYRRTRHNAGWMVIDRLVERWALSPPARPRRGQKAQTATAVRSGQRVLLVKPLTWMNESGGAVRALAGRERLRPEDILVVYDDLDLPLGRIRLRSGGSAGGHRGVRSVIERLGTTEFPRLRIGIGRPPPGLDPIDFVLMELDPHEQSVLADAVARAVEAVEVYLDEGPASAMNRFNSS